MHTQTSHSGSATTIQAGRDVVRVLLDALQQLCAHPFLPGRPPSASEYMQYIDRADWPAVSHIHKLARVASDDGTLLGSGVGTVVGAVVTAPSTALIAPGAPGASKQSSGEQPRPRHSPRAKPAAAWPVPATPKRDPIARSGSPLAVGARRERPNTPPPTIRKQPAPQNASKNSADAPTTPPGRYIKELVPPRRSGVVESFFMEKAIIMPPSRQRSSPFEADTPRRTTIAVQSQSTFWPKQPEEPLRNRSSPRPNTSPRSVEISIAPSDPRGRDRNATPPAIATTPLGTPPDDNDDMLIADRGNLSSEALARVHTLSRALHGLTLTSSVPSIFPSASMSTSSSSSSSSGGSGSATSTSSRHDGSTTTAGGSSDFTDFLSDDSDYELQRQAEERAAQLQKARFDRQDEREFRDAQQSLAAVGLTESMGLQTPPSISGRSIPRQVPQIHVRAHSSGGSSVPGNRRPPAIPPAEPLQTVFVSRYR